ncbi:hypothetical protein [Sphingomonas glacialis]|uniref:Peptidase M61 catalytic domain-containing protein n=1 Tax=Sphingomonas glacialis TaxID=658225 RepID=A0A502FRN3_9SPHN|nr:hypothetical protein [Sphingomonas glacialis]TPG52178.1 hypothetical protein EAH76_15875 [Sphingomonas glacialis]
MLNRRTAIIALGFGLAGASTLTAAPYDEPDELYAALREQPGERILFPDGAIDLVFADGARGIDRAAIRAWVRESADAVTRYFGWFPVAQYGLLVIAQPGEGVGHATTFGYGGSATRIHVGTAAGAAAFERDWVLVHEMFHAALPDLPRRALWLQEGNATWLEPVARVRAGYLPEAELWRQALIGMPRGEPGARDGGMDGTRDHDRLYWGGATFWLLVEIAIDAASHGKHGLRDAMRTVNRQSGGNATDWTPEQLMAAGDAAVGSEALSKLYRHFASGRATTDLPALFARLGVSAPGGRIRFDENAPLAGVRRRIVGRA